MKRFLVLMMAGMLAVFGLAACGDDDSDIAVTGETPPQESEDDAGETPTSDTGDAPEEAEEDAETAGENETGDLSGAPGASAELCDVAVAAVESLDSPYGESSQTEPGDGEYASCTVTFDDARVSLSTFDLDDPLVGGDFDAYIDSVGETVDDLEPVDDVGDAAVANEDGVGYALIGDEVVTVQRTYVGTAGDGSDFVDLLAAIAGALA